MNSSPCLHYDCTNRNSFGYCKTTACINEHYQQEQWGGTSNHPEKAVIKPMTNADRIRTMTDEELAVSLSGGCPWTTDGGTPPKCREYIADANRSCRQCWLDWLKQEVQDDTR